MNVLSLFDGMSCGQLALNKAGVEYDAYMASELKKHAIEVTQRNYPDTIQLGDVRGVTSEVGHVDLLIGGSPCQNLSIANKHDDRGLLGEKSSLFWEYVRVKNEINPTYFLLENVKMKGTDRDIITAHMGVEPIEINSADYTFQNRKRLYWTNIPFKRSAPVSSSFQDVKGTSIREPLDRYAVNPTPSRVRMWEGKCPDVTNRDTINCLTCKQDRWGNAGLVAHGDFCRYLTTEECELAQGVPVGYTDKVSIAKAYDLIGDGWTVDVIADIFGGLV